MLNLWFMIFSYEKEVSRLEVSSFPSSGQAFLKKALLKASGPGDLELDMPKRLNVFLFEGLHKCDFFFE